MLGPVQFIGFLLGDHLPPALCTVWGHSFTGIDRVSPFFARNRINVIKSKSMWSSNTETGTREANQELF